MAAHATLRALPAALLVAWALSAQMGSSFFSADPSDETSLAEAGNERIVRMQRFMVSATRIDKNPWRYGTVKGFEILTRADDRDSTWWLEALQRGEALENQLLPSDWLPESPVPNTAILDNTDLSTVPSSQLRSQTIEFHTPADALTWGRFSEQTVIWNDQFEARDQDTYAVNTDTFGTDTNRPVCVTGLERLFRCSPPLPRWLFLGLLGKQSGLFREGFMPVLDPHEDGWIRWAHGPGTLWVSLDETQRLLAAVKKDKKYKFAVPHLGRLFAEAQSDEAEPALIESEAALFARWGLMGPGKDDPSLHQAYLKLVLRARSEPVTEQLFTECFGFGYAAMEERLGIFLKEVLAQPTSVELNIPPHFEEADLKEATADQIGRILGDWLRMQSNSLRARDPEMSREFLAASGRMLERAYRDDNGLPRTWNRRARACTCPHAHMNRQRDPL